MHTLPYHRITPLQPSAGDPGVLHAVLERGRWNTRAHGRLQILKRKSCRSRSDFSGATLRIQHFFSWRLRPSQEQEAEKAPEEVEEYLETWATGKGWAAGGSFQQPKGPGARVWWLLHTPPSREAQQTLGFTTGDLQEEPQPQ